MGNIALDVVDVLKRKGIRVRDVRMAPRPWSNEYFRPDGVLLHHTASTSITDIAREASDVSVIKNVSWGPPGAQFYVGRTGTVWLICVAGANHAGSGNELVAHGVPADQGNYKLWGIECQSDGYGRDFTEKQWDVVHILTAELCRAMKVDEQRVWRHKDYDNDSGKVDTRYGLDAHRSAVQARLKEDSMGLTKDDKEFIRQALDNRIVAAAPAIARATAKMVLNKDLTTRNEDVEFDVRDALKSLYDDGGTTT